VVAGPELDGKYIGGHRGIPADDSRSVIEFSLQGSSHFNGLDFGAKGSSEGTIDELVEPAFKALEDAHEPSRTSAYPLRVPEGLIVLRNPDSLAC
jgi:hypothetical protein